MALEEAVGSPPNVVAESAQENATQITQSAESAFYAYWMRSLKQAHWTGTQVAIDLTTRTNRAGADVHREVQKCDATLSNRLSTIKAAFCEVKALVMLDILCRGCCYKLLKCHLLGQ